MHELRCGSKLHAVVDLESNTIEFACRSKFCGWQRGLVVLHRFDLTTHRLVNTRRFRAPERN